MADNLRYKGASKESKANSKDSGSSIDPGPYEAIVQGHVEGSRMGQLIVSIPEFSGIVDNPDAGNKSDQIVVSYASPFYGTTFGADQGNNPDGSATAGQSYGMWCVPPDVGNKVLVTFIAGDMRRGYWFACVYNSPNHHMVPGIGRNIGGSAHTKPTGAGEVDQYLSSDSVLPVGEYSISNSTAFNSDGLVNTPRYAHPSASMSYVTQGLDRDPVRGAISSSSMREAPSNVYGISTPGRKGTSSDQVPGDPDVVFYRSGGHSFVMDDGSAADGTDQLIRLRTSGGHQILMNDTEDILYVGSQSGSHWLEFSKNGSINIFSAGGFNLRSSGAINFHSDAAISMCAPHVAISALPNISGVTGKNLSVGSALGIIPSITINSAGTINTGSLLATTVKADGVLSVSALGAVTIAGGAVVKVNALGAMDVSALGVLNLGAKGAVNIAGAELGLNCTPPISSLPIIVPQVPPIPNFLPDTVWAGSGWLAGGSQITTSCSVAPAHEPWDRTAAASGGILGLAIGVANMAAGGITTGGSPV